MSTFRKTYLCKIRHSVTVYFDENRKAASGKLIPLEIENHQPHDCRVSGPFPCTWCHIRIYLDKNIVSEYGKRIPLDFATNEPHFCPKRLKDPLRERKFFRNRGVSED